MKSKYATTVTAFHQIYLKINKRVCT